MGHRALYAGDASNHRVLPGCVVFPRSTDDVIATVKSCAEAGVPLTSRGAGTNIAGNAVGPGVVLDFSRHLNRILDTDPERRTAAIQPGVVLDRLQEQVTAHGLRFGPDPSSHSRCTIGGMVGTNACGSHSVAWGTTADSVRELDIVLADGSTTTLGAGPGDSDLGAALHRLGSAYADQISAELGRFPRHCSGYALQHLVPGDRFHPAKAFVGSEGTCGVVTEVRVDLVRRPAARALVVAGFADDIAAARAAPALARNGVLTVEGLDDQLVATYDAQPGGRARPQLPAGRAWLLVEVPGDSAEQAEDAGRHTAQMSRDHGAQDVRVLIDPAEQRAMWTIREHGAGLATRTGRQEAWPGWEDAAVPPERLADYLVGFRKLLENYGRNGVVYGHFGEGCVHVRIDHDLVTDKGRAAYRSFQYDAADLVVAHSGSLSGEHGDGRARSELLGRMYDERMLTAFAEFKHAFDPANRFNPGILVDPVRVDSDLRLELSRPHDVGLEFSYPDDDGDFNKAVRRCVGVGACRKESGGGMCPSYRATQDEQHSTRGRARLLFEMLDGSLADRSWRSPEVNEALDLCLACKACASECPVSVDMATYKAEFLHQHYRHRLRPRSHLSMGWLPLWLAFARRAPRIANALGSRTLAKRMAGMDTRREVPQLARSAERPRMRGRAGESRPPGDTRETDRVVLWVDTFTRSFAPDVVSAAIEVLEAAGYAVELAGRRDCCGLTWVSTGQLGVARRVLGRTTRRLAETGDRPIVVLEPSCAASLRHDAPNLLGDDAARQVAGRVITLAQALQDRDVEGLFGTPAGSPEPAIAQFHCHQRSILGTIPDRELLSRLGIDVTSVDEGCCGLAGNFGMEDGHYDVSVRCAEQSFLPHLEDAPPETPVLADGFSCRVQIEQLAGRRPVHLAELLRDRLS
ncbi:MAG: FAD-binding protein [Propionibacteriales bacterium]|nr:FAD-binding protein [Propionibacteriales bacterium]